MEIRATLQKLKYSSPLDLPKQLLDLEASKKKYGWMKFINNLILKGDSTAAQFLKAWKIKDMDLEDRVPLCISLVVQKTLQEMFQVLKMKGSASGPQKYGL
jgi:hypothetical protein